MLSKLAALLLAGTALAACDEARPVTIAGSPPAPVVEQQQLLHVPLERSTSGAHYVRLCIAHVCEIPMMLDTGASDVSVPIPLFKAMINGGHLTRSEFIGAATYRTANGNVEGLRFVMPKMTIAGYEVWGVVGSVSVGDHGSTILLGQSFLRKFKAWQINNANDQLLLAY